MSLGVCHAAWNLLWEGGIQLLTPQFSSLQNQCLLHLSPTSVVDYSGSCSELSLRPDFCQDASAHRILREILDGASTQSMIFSQKLPTESRDHRAGDDGALCAGDGGGALRSTSPEYPHRCA